MFPTYKLRRKDTQPENTYDVVFEKAKGRGRAVNKLFMQKQPSEEFFKKGLTRNIAEFLRKHLCRMSFWCFLVNFAKFERIPFLQNSTGRLHLIIAVSIVAKGVLTNETVNYETRTKAYVLI